jgi:hypothetical protein
LMARDIACRVPITANACIEDAFAELIITFRHLLLVKMRYSKTGTEY